MASRIIVATLLALGTLSPATFAVPRSSAAPVRQLAVVSFDKATDVAGVLLNAGQYVIVHDAGKMARGEACTTFYRFGESGEAALEEAVSFHCIPREREVAHKTTLTMTTVPCDKSGCLDDWYMNKLLEYQFAGDSEGHGVPDRTPAFAGAKGSEERPTMQ